MTNSRGENLLNTQLKQFGSKEALSVEMSRRAKMRKTVGGGFRNNTELAKRAAAKSAEVRSKGEKDERPGGRTDLPEEKPTTTTPGSSQG